MNPIKVILLSICVLVASLNNASAQKKEVDNAYIEKMRPLISFRPFTNHHLDALILNYPKSVESPLMYRPATGLNVGGEFAFSFIHINYQRNIPVLQPDFPDGTKPYHQRLGLDIGGNVFGVNMNFQRNKGFYLLNKSAYKYDIPVDDNSVEFRSDMNSISYGVDFRFTFSTRLSANAIFNQNERQLKSKGAFTLIVGDDYHKILGGGPLLPDSVQFHYSESADVHKIWVNNFHVLPGYGYIAVAGKWNFGLFLHTGSGLQIRNYEGFSTDKTGIRFPFIAKGRTGITYNGRNLYTRLTATGDFTTLGMKDANFRWMRSFIEFSIGLRFYAKE